MTTNPSTETVSLYQRLLGDAWHALPDVLKRVHGTDAQVAAIGAMDVTLGRFIGAGLVRWALRMPRTEGRVPVELRVRRNGQGEEWDRRIGGWRFRTEQWAENGLMAETFGPLLFLASVSSDQESVSHVSRRMLLCALGTALARAAPARDPHVGSRSSSSASAPDARWTWTCASKRPSGNCWSPTTERFSPLPRGERVRVRVNRWGNGDWSAEA